MILASVVDSGAAWAGIIVCALALIGAVVGVLRWFLRHEIAEIIENTAQLKPNGGSHLADSVQRIEAATAANTDTLRAQGESMARLAGAFEQHTREHRGR